MVANRETHIIIADKNGLFPAENIFPSDDLFPSDAGFAEITNIVAGSMSIEELIAEEVPQFGQIFASKFECTVYLTDDISDKFVHVYQVIDGVTKSVFFGKIESCKQDKVGTDRKIVAYDLAYDYGKLNVAEWWENFWSNRESAQLKQVRDSLLENFSLPYEDVVLPNDDLVVHKTVELSSCTLTAMLKMICELNYCFPHMNRDGVMNYIMLNTAPETTVDLTGKYDWTNSEYEEYVTHDITGVQFFDSGSELKYTYGDTTNAYPVSQNIFLYDQPTSVLHNIAVEMMGYLSEFKYTPVNLKMIVGDLDYKLGDYIHTEKCDSYIMQNVLSGSQLFDQEIKSQGNQFLYGGTANFDYNDVILNEKIARVNQTVEAFEVDYEDFKEGTAANFRVTAQQISSEVSRATEAEGNLSSRITQTAEAITSEVSRATDVESALSSRITQTATEITGLVTAETNARVLADSTAFANYVGQNNNTAAKVATATGSSSWNTDALKKQHAGEIYYDTVTKHYWMYTVTLNSSTGAVSSASWVDKGVITNTYNLVTNTAESKLSLTSTSFTVAINTETSSRIEADAVQFANYTGTYNPTTSNSPASGWNTDAKKKAHAGEVFYNTSTKKYYQWKVTLKDDGSINTYGWTDVTSSHTYDLVTSTASSKLELTDKSFSVQISTEKTERQQADLASTYNYTGDYEPKYNNYPASSWTTDAVKATHVGEVFYRSDTKKYYVYQKSGNSYGWTITTKTIPFDLVTVSSSAKFSVTDEMIKSEITRATNAEGDLASSITQTVDSIAMEVTNGETSSSIKLKRGETEITSGTIKITGMVTFTDLSTSGKTTINGGNITTGTIDASKVTVTNLNASNITAGDFSADRIKGGKLTIDTTSGYATAIEVKNNGRKYVDISGSKGLIVGEEYGSNRITITENGLTVGRSAALTTVTLKGDYSNGALILGNNTNSITSVYNGKIEITNGAYSGDPTLKLTTNSSTAALYIKGSSSGTAIQIEDGSCTFKGVSCGALTCSGITIGSSSYSGATFKFNGNEYEAKEILGFNASNTSTSLSQLYTKKLNSTTLWAVDTSSSYSSPDMVSVTGGYAFRNKPTWKRIELADDSKFFGVLPYSSYGTPSLTKSTVLSKK